MTKDIKTGKETEEEWVYDNSKLTQWLHLNIRTFKHLNEDRIDKNWTH
jgi:hypothetical protein